MEVRCPHCGNVYDSGACRIPTRLTDVGTQATIVCHCGKRFEVSVGAVRPWRRWFRRQVNLEVRK